MTGGRVPGETIDDAFESDVRRYWTGSDDYLGIYLDDDEPPLPRYKEQRTMHRRPFKVKARKCNGD